MIFFNKFLYGAILCLSVGALFPAANDVVSEATNSESPNPTKLGIYNGEEVAKTADPSFPTYMVVIHGRKSSHKPHGCAGYLLDNEHVLTTASCMKNLGKPSQVQVRYGTSNIQRPIYLDIKVQKVAYHPKYKHRKADEDSEKHPPLMYNIAIVTLKDPIDEDGEGKIDFVKLSKIRDIPGGTSVGVYGWGTKGKGNKSFSAKLLKGDMNIVWKKYCHDKYGKNGNQVICAINSKVGLCKNDDADALIFDNKLVGLAVLPFEKANDHHCHAGEAFPFVNVAVHRAWILKKIGVEPEDDSENGDPDNGDQELFPDPLDPYGEYIEDGNSNENNNYNNNDNNNGKDEDKDENEDGEGDGENEEKEDNIDDIDDY